MDESLGEELTMEWDGEKESKRAFGDMGFKEREMALARVMARAMGEIDLEDVGLGGCYERQTRLRVCSYTSKEDV